MPKATPQHECRHIFINGTKCRAIALLQSPWCFYHKRLHQAPPRTKCQSSNPEPTPETQTIDLPHLEDTSSIQLGINNVLQALAANRIDAKRAGLLLYGLQIALASVAAQERSPVTHYNTVDHLAYTANGTPLALSDPGSCSTGSLESYSDLFHIAVTSDNSTPEAPPTRKRKSPGPTKPTRQPVQTDTKTEPRTEPQMNAAKPVSKSMSDADTLRELVGILDSMEAAAEPPTALLPAARTTFRQTSGPGPFDRRVTLPQNHEPAQRYLPHRRIRIAPPRN